MARVNGKKGEYSLALESIRAAIDRAPARASYQYELGHILRDAGKLPEAVEAWKQAVKLEPGYADAWEAMGGAYLESSRYKEAIGAFEAALKADPARARVLGLMGDAHFQAGKLKDAVASYSAALKADPSLTGLYYRLGRAHSEMGQYDKAIGFYQRGLASKPDDPQGWYHLGYALKERGKKREAVAAFQTYLAKAPDAKDKKDIEDENLLPVQVAPARGGHARGSPVMLDLKWVAQNFDSVVERLSARGGNLDLGDFRALMAERSAVYPSLESLQAKRNAANEEMKREAKEDPAALERLRGDLRALGQEIKELEKRRDAVEERLQAVNLTLPNVPDASVPVGATEKDNVVVRTWGEKPRFPFTPKQHFELGEKLGMLDFERAAKVSGSRFVFYKGDLARLERALVRLHDRRAHRARATRSCCRRTW